MRLGVDLPHGGDLVHVGARAQEHRLDEPDGLLAQLVVGRAVISLFVANEDLLGIDPAKALGFQRSRGTIVDFQAGS